MCKFCAKSCFHRLVQKSHKFHVIVNMNDIVCIEYLKYSNKWDFFFEWHTWMFMFHMQKLHSFTQNYIMIIVWILLKCKSYVLHIKTSQEEKKYHLYKNNMYVLPFLHFKAYGFKTLWSLQCKYIWLQHRKFLSFFTILIYKKINILYDNACGLVFFHGWKPWTFNLLLEKDH